MFGRKIRGNTEKPPGSLRRRLGDRLLAGPPGSAGTAPAGFRDLWPVSRGQLGRGKNLSPVGRAGSRKAGRGGHQPQRAAAAAPGGVAADRYGAGGLPGWRCFHSAGPCFWWTGDWYKKGPPPWAALGAVPLLKQLPAVRIFPAARSQRPLCGFSKTPAAWRRSAGFRRERRSPS